MRIQKSNVRNEVKKKMIWGPQPNLRGVRCLILSIQFLVWEKLLFIDLSQECRLLYPSLTLKKSPHIPTNFKVCARWKCLDKQLKICHIFETRLKNSFFISSFWSWMKNRGENLFLGGFPYSDNIENFPFWSIFPDILVYNKPQNC